MKRINNLDRPVSISLLLILCACNASVTYPTATVFAALPTSAQSAPTSTSTLVFSQDLTPSPTDNQSVSESSEYCQPPSAFLPVEDGNDISEDEIVYKLLDMWLRRYASPNAHPDCRIDGYTIDRVYYDLDLISKSLEPRGDFMRVVIFSVKPIQTSNHWMGFSGELDESNWLHLSQVVAAFKTNDGYTITFAHP
jgi:hypothetical protein